MPAQDQVKPGRGPLLAVLAAHLVLLALVTSGVTDRLAFETSFQKERPSTLEVHAAGVRSALAGRGFYDTGHLGAVAGPFDPMADRGTPAGIALLGAPFAFVPDGWRTLLWFLLNEILLLCAALLILRRTPRRGVAIAFLAAWAVGTPYLIALATETPVMIAALALLAVGLLEGRGAAAAFALLAVLRPFTSGILLHALRARRWSFAAAAGIALLLTALLFALHPSDFYTLLGRHPYGGSYPGNLGLQAFLFSAVRNLVPDHPLSLPIAGRVIYDLNILSLILQRILVFAFVAAAALLSLRARKREQTGAVAALWACTWIAVGVEVSEADFLLVIAGAAALAMRMPAGWLLASAALWLALPTPFVALPLEGILSRSPEFGWTTTRTLALHGWKLIPSAIVYGMAARTCYRA